MRTSLNVALLATVLVTAAASCSFRSGEPEPDIGSEAASAASPVTEQCQPVVGRSLVGECVNRQDEIFALH